MSDAALDSLILTAAIIIGGAIAIGFMVYVTRDKPKERFRSKPAQE